MGPGDTPIFHFSLHFLEQLVERGFDAQAYRQIFLDPDDRFLDTISDTEAAVKAIP